MTLEDLQTLKKSMTTFTSKKQWKDCIDNLSKEVLNMKEIPADLRDDLINTLEYCVNQYNGGDDHVEVNNGTNSGDSQN